MSRREKERQESLDLLARIVARSTQAPPQPKPATAPPPPRPAPRPMAPAPPPARRAPAPPPPPPNPYATTEAERLRRRQMEERKAKLEEERALRDRRAGELHRARSLEWRGGGFSDIPASIRRTGFDRREPTVDAKITDVLGAAREKESRLKNREKGRRQGGR